MRSEDKQSLYRKKQSQLKLLVAVSLVIIVAVWLIWILRGGLTRQRPAVEVELFGNIIKKTEQSSAGLLQIKDEINNSWQQLQAATEAAQKQQEILSKLKDKIGEVSTSSATTGVTSTSQGTAGSENNSE